MQYPFFFREQTHSDCGILWINSARLRRLRGVGTRLNPLAGARWAPGYDVGLDAPRPSSHARRQGLGSPRAIGTHMRRPRLRKCFLSLSLSLLFCPFISLDPRQRVRSPIRDFRRFHRKSVDTSTRCITNLHRHFIQNSPEELV